MDGLEVAGQTVVVTLGITIDGTKVPLGIWLGSTENSRVCTAMLQNLLERGLRIDESILCVVDGGKGIRKALVDVLGDLAVIQRCQLHKLRNLRSYLPKSRHAYVLQTMKGSVQMQECRQGAQATSGIGVVARAKRLRRSCRKPSRRDGRDPHGCEARSTRVTSQISGHDKRHRESQRHHPQSLEKRQAVEESFHDSPMDRSRRRHGGDKSFTVSKAIAIWALSFTRLEANRNLLTAMRLLPKSIHRSQLFEEGTSFSGFERDALYLARGDGTYMDVSGVSGLRFHQ